MIERYELCRLIPHSGSMCLLDRVLEWDSRDILCETNSHLVRTNPLYSEGELSSVAAIEYGAQAMAIHGSLLSSKQTTEMQKSYLAAIRDVKFGVSWLHDINHPLTVRAERLLGDSQGKIYQFSLHALSSLLVQGRITVMMSS